MRDKVRTRLWGGYRRGLCGWEDGFESEARGKNKRSQRSGYDKHNRSEIEEEL